MRVVCISDTHSLHSSVKIPDGDLLVHAGDFTGHGTTRDLIAFNAWLGKFPHPHKIVIPGNHESICQEDPHHSRALLSEATLLLDQSVEIEGFKIYGSPWTPEFGDWSFMLPRGSGMRAVWSGIPEDLDLLITHGPPMGILDGVLKNPYDPSEGKWNVGCADLLVRVLSARPRFHVFGHIHEGYGTLTREGTTFVNASICDGGYSPINAPIVFEL